VLHSPFSWPLPRKYHLIVFLVIELRDSYGCQLVIEELGSIRCQEEVLKLAEIEVRIVPYHSVAGMVARSGSRLG
jgi:hypothetical protein